jgi:hypothetical protein
MTYTKQEMYDCLFKTVYLTSVGCCRHIAAKPLRQLEPKSWWSSAFC